MIKYDTFTLTPINTRPICSVWSKIGTFQRSLVHMKSPSIIYMSLPLLRALRWGTVWTFISRGIRNTKSQTFSFLDLLNKTGLFCNFWLWHLVTLIPIEIKLHSVPHFKALNSDEDIFGGEGHGRTFKVFCVLSKYLHFTP